VFLLLAFLVVKNIFFKKTADGSEQPPPAVTNH
jgi:hypothetical protein